MPEHSSLTELHLQHGDWQLSLCPALGGAITALRFGGLDVLRPWDGSDSVRRSGCFVLAPYSNRMGGGQFSVDGQRHVLRRNSPDHDLPIHGVVWKRQWQVLEQRPDGLTLGYTHHADAAGGALDWPFGFRLEYRLHLDGNALRLQLRLHNRDARPMPAGLGWHPYFPRHDAVMLQFVADQVWHGDANQLPARAGAVPPDWDFSVARPLEEPGLDNCFAGWNRQARIRWPRRGLELALEADAGLDHLVVFTPPAVNGFFAVEPVSHLNNALNQPDPAAHGVQWLAPGESMQRGWTLRIATRPATA